MNDQKKPTDAELTHDQTVKANTAVTHTHQWYHIEQPSGANHLIPKPFSVLYCRTCGGAKKIDHALLESM